MRVEFAYKQVVVHDCKYHIAIRVSCRPGYKDSRGFPSQEAIAVVQGAYYDMQKRNAKPAFA